MMPKAIFSMPFRIANEVDLTPYPLLYRGNYEIWHAAIGKQACLVVIPKGSVKPAQLQKVIATLEGRERVPCVVYCPALTAFQRASLTERGIAWIAAEDVFSIPFLAVSSRRQNVFPARSLSPSAQLIAVRLIDQSWEGLSSTQIAHRMGKSLSSVGNYLREIEAIQGAYIAHRGRTRYLDRAGRTAHEVYDELRLYLSTPVKRREYYAIHAGDGSWRSLPLSGVSALSRQSLLQDDPWVTVAVGPSDNQTFDSIVRNWEVVSIEDAPDVCVEYWAYDPAPMLSCVDNVSLLLDLEELVKNSDDERLAYATDQFARRVFDER